MDRGHDRIAAGILGLLGLRGVGAKSVTAFLAEASPLIESEGRIDADLVDASAASGTRSAAKLSRALQSTDRTWEELTSEACGTLSYAEEHGVHVLHPFAPAYPGRLLRNSSFPPVLYALGDLSALDPEKAIAIVGTREPTDFGRRMGRRFAQLMAEDGYTVVSGLALGCDTAGHEGALDARGRTVAVLPTPIGSPVYPRQNRDLADRIVESGGALVSEYAPGTAIPGRQLASNLVARDEWQPALSDGLLVIESSATGGTRHAVGHAFETGTPVAAFDYRPNERLRAAFETEARFSGNREYLAMDPGAASIYGPESIESFKGHMEAYRRAASGLRSDSEASPDAKSGQMALFPM